MLERLGHFVFRHRRAVIVAWLVILAVCAFLAPKVSSRLTQGASNTSRGEAADGYRLLEQELGIHTEALVIVFTSETLRVDDPLFSVQMNNALAGLDDLPDLCDPITCFNTGDPRLISGDGHTTYANVAVNGDNYRACQLVPTVREELSPQPDLAVFVTGQPPMFYDAETAAMEDMDRVGMITFPLLAIVLVLVFGSLVAAGLPLVIGIASIAVTMGLVFFLSQLLNITSSSLTVVAFLGLGNGVDYALIMVSRFREELRKGQGVEECLVTTCKTSGQAILFSAITTVIGLTFLVTFDNPVQQSIGIGGSAVVTLALAAGLTLLPAVLAVLGRRVNSLTLFHLSEDKGTFWQRLARWEMSHPIVVLIVLLPTMGLLIWPVFSMNGTNISYASIPETTQARQGYDVLTEGFGPGEVAPIMICVATDDKITDWDNIYCLYEYTHRIAMNEEVARVDSIVDLDSSITRDQYQLLYASLESITDPRLKDAINRMSSEHAALVRVYVRSDPMGEEARTLVASIRDMSIGSLETYVAGPVAIDEDMNEQVLHRFLWVFLLMMVITYLSLFWLLKSVLLPLKAIILNLASVAATYGILIFVFQQGHFGGVLNFTSDGTINLQVLIIVFCIVFGISMDYEVFLLSRIKEEWEKTKDNTASVALGLAQTGRVITSSSLVMVATFGTFAISELVFLKMVGLGLAIAILLDATIIRIMMAPALMRILGKWNWWAPSFLRRPWAEERTIAR